jgi:serine/threonine protein kinase
LSLAFPFARGSFHPSLAHWYKTKSGPSFSPKGFALLERMFEYDPSRRCTAREALDSPFFREAEGVNLKCAVLALLSNASVRVLIRRLLPRYARSAFQGTRLTYPDRRVTNDDLTLTSQQSQPLPASLVQQQGGGLLPQSRPGSLYPATAGTAAVVAAGGGSIPPPAPPTNPPPPVYPPTGPGTGGPTRPGSYRPGSTGGGGGGGGGGASVGATGSGSGRGAVGKKSRLG